MYCLFYNHFSLFVSSAYNPLYTFTRLFLFVFAIQMAWSFQNYEYTYWILVLRSTLFIVGMKVLIIINYQNMRNNLFVNHHYIVVIYRYS